MIEREGWVNRNSRSNGNLCVCVFKWDHSEVKSLSLRHINTEEPKTMSNLWQGSLRVLSVLTSKMIKTFFSRQSVCIQVFTAARWGGFFPPIPCYKWDSTCSTTITKHVENFCKVNISTSPCCILWLGTATHTHTVHTHEQRSNLSTALWHFTIGFMKATVMDALSPRVIIITWSFISVGGRGQSRSPSPHA